MPMIYNEHSESQKKFLYWYLGFSLSDMVTSYQKLLGDVFITCLIRNIIIIYNLCTKRNGGLPILYIFFDEVSKVTIYKGDSLKNKITKLILFLTIKIVYMPYLYSRLHNNQKMIHNDHFVYKIGGTALYTIFLYRLIRMFQVLKL